MEEKIFQLIETLSPDERDIFKGSLSRQIDQFFDENNNIVLINADAEDKFNLLASALKKLGSSSHTIPQNGIVYYGRPGWLSRELLEKLQNEAVDRRHEPLEQIDHVLGCGGKYADRLADSEELLKFIESLVGPVAKTGIASYIYYDKEGTGIRPHVDTGIFSINLILMLRHSHDENINPSATVVFPAYQKPEYYRLQIGEVMIMYGGSVIHTRTIIQAKETVHLLTIGFNPL